MGILGSGGKYKSLGTQALLNATTLQNEQRDIDFGRELLQNIRQERLARSQIVMGSYNDETVSSGTAGQLGNIDSTLASEVGYAYRTGARQDKITSLQQEAKRNFDKYKKVMKTNQQAGMALAAVGGLAGGVFIGGALAAAGMGAVSSTMLGTAIGGLAGTGTAVGIGGGGAAGRAGLYQTFQDTLTAGAKAYAADKLMPTKVPSANPTSGITGATDFSTNVRLARVTGQPAATYTPIYDLNTLASTNMGIWGF